MLAAGADAIAQDDTGDTPLHTMALLSTLGVKEIEALVAAGADIMALDNGGDTPLHMAAWGGRPETIKALVAAGADVMAQNASGDTPLHAAAEINGATDVKNNILALLAAGADVMVQNKDGKIPWDYAKNNDDIDETDEYTALKKATCGWGYWFKNLVGLCG